MYLEPKSVVFYIYYNSNPPTYLNLETMGRDLRELTCLSMRDIPGRYKFIFAQGVLTGKRLISANMTLTLVIRNTNKHFVFFFMDLITTDLLVLLGFKS